jgi:hypothetical protein
MSFGRPVSLMTWCARSSLTLSASHHSACHSACQPQPLSHEISPPPSHSLLRVIVLPSRPLDPSEVVMPTAVEGFDGCATRQARTQRMALDAATDAFIPLPPDRETTTYCTTRSRDLAMTACVKSGSSASRQVRLTVRAFVMHIGMHLITPGRRSGFSSNSVRMLLTRKGEGFRSNL